MKKADIRKKDISELQKSVVDMKRKLADLRFKFSSNKLKNVKEINQVKKEIARMLTAISEDKSEIRNSKQIQNLNK